MDYYSKDAVVSRLQESLSDFAGNRYDDYTNQKVIDRMAETLKAFVPLSVVSLLYDDPSTGHLVLDWSGAIEALEVRYIGPNIEVRMV